MQGIDWPKLLPPVIFMAVILAMFWWTVIKPAKRRQQDHVSLIDSISEGDEIITVGGLYGKVTKVREDNFDLEVAPNVRLKFDRRAVRIIRSDKAGDVVLSPWLLAIPVVLSLVALGVGVMALITAAKARTLATPTPQMQRLAETLRGQEAEQLLAQLLGQVQGQDTRLRDLENAAELMRNQLKGAVQKVGLHRFNSDKEMGGNLSFVLVMLDSRDHGLMLTCIHSLESGRIFLRGVVGGQTDKPLLPEEQVAMQQALSS